MAKISGFTWAGAIVLNCKNCNKQISCAVAGPGGEFEDVVKKLVEHECVSVSDAFVDQTAVAHGPGHVFQAGRDVHVGRNVRINLDPLWPY